MSSGVALCGAWRRFFENPLRALTRGEAAPEWGRSMHSFGRSSLSVSGGGISVSTGCSRALASGDLGRALARSESLLAALAESIFCLASALFPGTLSAPSWSGACSCVLLPRALARAEQTSPERRLFWYVGLSALRSSSSLPFFELQPLLFPAPIPPLLRLPLLVS